MLVGNQTELTKLGQQLAAKEAALSQRVFICCGTGCLAGGSREIATEFEKQIREKGIKLDVDVGLCSTGCHGFCQRGPLVIIKPSGVFYTGVKLADVSEIVEKTVKNGEIIERLLYSDPVTKQKITKHHDVQFYARQKRIALRNCGYIDPNDIKSYLATGGYQSLAKVLSGMKPEEVIDSVAKAGLRGRGGGGFETAKKWRLCRSVQSDRKFIICNGDEGDPGAFMDRSMMEGDPHAILEGMIIGAYAIGAHEGYIYVRHEYPLALKHLNQAITEAREYGFLGKNIFGSGFDFDIKINRGGGAFVCGESSALMRSIEGEVGEPRAKYIHATEKGLLDKPTVLNNVETWINVPYIITKGAEGYAAMGTAKSKGTKVFSLVGKVKNTGLVEVPMGATLRDIIFGVGGGIINNKPFKAVQTGGPSGGCIPESLIDLPVDFERLTEAGSMMGSGGMIVMDDRTCMVDVAKYFTKFLIGESCGKCVPCREGLKQLFALLDDITSGTGTPDYLKRIRVICDVMQDSSLCALGTSAPNPVLSTIKYFEEEYLEHIEKKRCRAGVCRDLTTFTIIEKCVGCTVCAKKCPAKAITGKTKELHQLDQKKCIKCGVCYDVCKFNAVKIN
jgi:NADH-quinone oxidoreductase subunit F